jgi:hypothetical protein
VVVGRGFDRTNMHKRKRSCDGLASHCLSPKAVAR